MLSGNLRAFRRFAVAASIHLALFSSTLVIHAAEDARGDSVSFKRDVAPILVQKCLQCHGAERPKGGYRVDQFALIVKPGDSDLKPIEPGNPDGSELYHRISTSNEDDRMPQKDDPLPSEQIATILRWIEQGATFDGGDETASIEFIAPRMPHPEPPETYRRPVPILALAFRPDGAELAASGYHEITIWNTADGKLIRRIKNLPERVQSIAYSPNGRFLGIAGGSPGRSGEAVIVDAESGRVERVLGVSADVMLAMTFSPDGQRVAFGGADNTIRIFEWAHGKEELVIQQHADWVMALDFSPDGTHLVSASRDRTARVYKTSGGELETSYTDHNAPVTAIRYGSEKNQVFSGGRDREIHIWNPEEGKKAGEIGGFEGEIFRIIASENAIISCGASKVVRMHDAKERKKIREFTGHNDWIYALAVHEESKRLASGSHDGEVRIWSMDDGKCVVSFTAAP